MRVVLAVLVVTTLVGCSSAHGPGRAETSSPKGHHKPSPGPSESAAASPQVPPAFSDVTCPSATTVHSAGDLSKALAAVHPGDAILLADGIYAGKFVATVSGTSAQPIFLCGGTGAVLDGGGIKAGYALHLDHASYWRLAGFTVRNAQKGVVLDASQHSVVQGLTVSDIGDEAIHVRTASSDNVVSGNTVHDTGKRRDKFGEGVYVGSAESNWCKYSKCGPDRSDRNLVRANHISATTAESVDIKEGTSSGWLVDNTFDGSSLSGADSWVDVKGNGWLISGNTGHHSPLDGFQTHQVVAAWGAGNLFRANTANVEGPGYGINLTPVAGNSVTCDNRAPDAAKGLSNVACG
ncbi:MAG TPA: right-handed parallel beta-helix repeat-containing protein [Jatrophihabitantaceae bacterium]|jgi:hypothetical protein